jgi:hypothetical protein
MFLSVAVSELRTRNEKQRQVAELTIFLQTESKSKIWHSFIASCRSFSEFVFLKTRLLVSANVFQKPTLGENS